MSDKFRIFETERFTKDLESNLGTHKDRIIHKLLNYVYPQLKEQPYFGKNIKKLRNFDPDTWRYRIGDHRFFYSINEEKKLMIMLTVDLRKDAY